MSQTEASPARLSPETIGALLRCPRCRGRLAVAEDGLTCAGCGEHYSARPGELTVYDLFIDEQPRDVGRDPAQIWRRDVFDKGYERIGYHGSGVEFDKQLGYPPEVSQFLFERVKKRMVEWVRPGPDHAILDVGCGAGYFLFLMREKYRAQGYEPLVAGIDISPHQVSYMAERMRREGVPRVIAATGNGEYLPFADESFDLVTCSEVIEHIRNPGRALEEMRRVLKPDGMLLLSTPSMSAQKGWGAVLLPATALVKALTRYKPTKDVSGGYDIPWYAKEFQKTIRGADIRIHEFEYNAVIPHPWHFMFLPRWMVRPTVGVFTFIDRFVKYPFRSLALHFVVRASRVWVLALLAALAFATPTIAQQIQAKEPDQEVGWINRNYYAKDIDADTKALVANVERNHLAQANFWKKYKEGHIDLAIADLKYCLWVFPDHPKALHLLGVLCKSQKDYSTPITFFEKAVRLFPSEAFPHAQYGAYLVGIGQVASGTAQLKEALRIDPNLTYAQAWLITAEKGSGTRPAKAP